GLYVHLLARMVLATWRWPLALGLVIVSGLCHSLQSTAADFVRNAFLHLGGGGKGELDLPEDIKPGAGPLERLFLIVYRDYVRRQEMLFPRTTALVRRFKRPPVPSA